MVSDGGPARVALSGVPRIDEVTAAVSAARGVSRHRHGRWIVTAGPARLVDAAGRVGGAELAELLDASLDQALTAWIEGPGDVVTPAGTLPTSRRPVVMGILNVTPDSFSDGGAAFDPDDHPASAVAAGRALVDAGADVVDVGGESTRPGAQPVAVEVELERVVPVIQALAASGIVVSVDTSKSIVAREAVAAGAAIVNDVTAGLGDEAMLPTIAGSQAAYVAMHMRGTPATMQEEPSYGDVVGDVFDFLAERLAALEAIGVERERLIVDPGIGFGKTAEHNLELLHRLRELTSLGVPVLVGASRKAFIGSLTGEDDPAARLEGSLAAAAVAVARGARLLRVHDVAETVRAVRVAGAVAIARGEQS